MMLATDHIYRQAKNSDGTAPRAQLLDIACRLGSRWVAETTDRLRLVRDVGVLRESFDLIFTLQATTYK